MKKITQTTAQNNTFSCCKENEGGNPTMIKPGRYEKINPHFAVIFLR